MFPNCHIFLKKKVWQFEVMDCIRQYIQSLQSLPLVTPLIVRFSDFLKIFEKIRLKSPQCICPINKYSCGRNNVSDFGCSKKIDNSIFTISRYSYNRLDIFLNSDNANFLFVWVEWRRRRELYLHHFLGERNERKMFGDFDRTDGYFHK